MLPGRGRCESSGTFDRRSRLVLSGLWSLTGMGHDDPPGRLVTRMITRTGARVFYVVVGGAMIVVGTLMTIGVIAAT